jgi:hypothetical protein
MSMFHISIVRADGTEVKLRPGGRGERDLIDAVVARVATKGVAFRPTTHVLTDVRAALTEELWALKSEVVP